MPETILLHGEPVTAVAWLPDGTHLVSGAEDAALSVWDVEGASRLRTFGGHDGPITALACSPDGVTHCGRLVEVSLHRP